MILLFYGKGKKMKNVARIVEEILKISKIEVFRDVYLKFPDGSVTSLDDRSWVVVDNGKEEAKIKKDNRGIYVDIANRYDKRFKTMKDLVKWLNKERYKYVGID